MVEPQAVADRVEEVVPGVFHWRIADERIGGFTSAAHAVADDAGTVLIDPLPLAADELERLEPVGAIALTAATHQRSAWRYRSRFGVRVWLPEGSRATDEPADESYGSGALLPGGLEAVHTPGPEQPHYCLLDRARGVLFCSDLLAGSDGRLEFVPAEYHEDPEQTRRSVESLLELPFETLCLAHGTPITDDPHAAIRRLLADG